MICEEKRLIETLLRSNNGIAFSKREKADNTPALFIEKNASAVGSLSGNIFYPLQKQSGTFVAEMLAFFPHPLAGSSFLLSGKI